MLGRLSRITNKPAKTAVQQNFANKAFQARRTFEGAYFSTGRALTTSSLLFSLPMVDMVGPPLLNLLGFSFISGLGMFKSKRPSIRLATFAGFAMAGGLAGDPFVALLGEASPLTMLIASGTYAYKKTNNSKLKTALIISLVAMPGAIMGLFRAIMFRPTILALPLGLLGEIVGSKIGSGRLQQQLPNFTQDLSDLLKHQEVIPEQIVEQLMSTPRIIGRRGSLRFNKYLLKNLLEADADKFSAIKDLLNSTKRGQRILKKTEIS